MKRLRMVYAVALMMAVLFSFGVMTASAEQPAPTQVAYLDNQAHTLAAGASQLFRFDYALKDDGTRPLVWIRLANGTNSGVNFGIWTADQLHARAITAGDAMADPMNNQPIGRGTAANINCTDQGRCASPDLTWVGSFGSTGTYFVEVVNSNPAQANYQLTINGSGVSLAPRTQITFAAPVQGPAAAPPLVATTTTNPTTAGAIDGQAHNLPANASTWYRIDYAIKDDGTRPQIDIRLVKGTASGMNFEVWTADQLHAQAITAADAMADPMNNQPIGRGTAANVNCDTGRCSSPDLTWTGAFGSGGSYYVHVINNNASDGSYQLVMTVH